MALDVYVSFDLVVDNKPMPSTGCCECDVDFPPNVTSATVNDKLVDSSPVIVNEVSPGTDLPDL